MDAAPFSMRIASAADLPGLRAIRRTLNNPEGKAGRLDSYGIKGMRERAAAIGGKLDVDSTPGQGTRIRCVVTANA